MSATFLYTATLSESEPNLLFRTMQKCGIIVRIGCGSYCHAPTWYMSTTCELSTTTTKTGRTRCCVSVMELYTQHEKNVTASQLQYKL